MILLFTFCRRCLSIRGCHVRFLRLLVSEKQIMARMAMLLTGETPVLRCRTYISTPLDAMSLRRFPARILRLTVLLMELLRMRISGPPGSLMGKSLP